MTDERAVHQLLESRSLDHARMHLGIAIEEARKASAKKYYLEHLEDMRDELENYSYLALKFAMISLGLANDE